MMAAMNGQVAEEPGWPTPQRPVPKYRRASTGWAGWISGLAVGIGCTVGSVWVLLGLTSPLLAPQTAQRLFWLQVTTQLVAVAVVLAGFASKGARTSFFRAPLVLLAAGAASLGYPFVVVTIVVSNARLNS